MFVYVHHCYGSCRDGSCRDCMIEKKKWQIEKERKREHEELRYVRMQLLMSPKRQMPEERIKLIKLDKKNFVKMACGLRKLSVLGGCDGESNPGMI